MMAACTSAEPADAATLCPPSSDETSVWRFFLECGIGAYRGGRFSEADEHFDAGRALAQALGKTDEFEQTRLYMVGSVERDQGRLELASAYLRKALRIPCDLNCQEPWKILDELAELLCRQDKFPCAERLYKSFCTVAYEKLGAEHFFLRAALAKLGMLYLCQRKSSAARKLGKQIYGNFTETA